MAAHSLKRDYFFIDITICIAPFKRHLKLSDEVMFYVVIDTFEKTKILKVKSVVIRRFFEIKIKF